MSPRSKLICFMKKIILPKPFKLLKFSPVICPNVHVRVNETKCRCVVEGAIICSRDKVSRPIANEIKIIQGSALTYLY